MSDFIYMIQHIFFTVVVAILGLLSIYGAVIHIKAKDYQWAFLYLMFSALFIFAFIIELKLLT